LGNGKGKRFWVKKFQGMGKEPLFLANFPKTLGMWREPKEGVLKNPCFPNHSQIMPPP